MNDKIQYVQVGEENEQSDILFTLSHDLMFGLVMQDVEICKGLLERIFPERKIHSLKFNAQSNIQIQKTITTGIIEKGIRMDVVFEDDQILYDIEMQRGDVDHLPKRCRYYSSAMDIDQIRKGDNYNQLKKQYIIFICTFDYFGKNQAIYRFENYDRKNDLSFGDEAYKIMLNTSAPEETIPLELRTFFAYVNTLEIPKNDEFIEKIHQRVKKYNTTEWRRQMMTIEQEIERRAQRAEEEGMARGMAKGIEQGLAKGIEQGLEKGIAEGRIKGIIETCKKHGLSRDAVLTELIDDSQLSPSEAENYMTKYW